MVLTNAIGRNGMMIPLAHLFACGARQDLNDLIDPKIDPALLAQPKDARKELLRFNGTVISSARRQAVIAGAAIFRLKCLAEITQQRDTAALSALRQLHHLSQLLPRDVALVRVG